MTLADAQALVATGRLLAAERLLRARLGPRAPSPRDPRTAGGTRADEDAEARALLGAVLQLRGHPAAAVAEYEAALGAWPDDADLRSNLAHALLEAGRGEVGLELLRAAPSAAAGRASDAARAPHPRLQAAEGALLLALDRLAEARDLLRPLTASGRTDDMAWVNLAIAERGLGAPERALAALREACDIDPDNARAVAERIEVLIGLGRTDEACALADGFLEAHPGDGQVLAACALALWAAGRDDEAAAIADPPRMVGVHDHGDSVLTASLRTELVALLRDDPAARDDPSGKATRGGRQTGELDPASHPALLALESLLTDLLDAGSRGGAELRMWGTLLPPGGMQRPHNHPLGHASGVVYLELPPDMQAEDPAAGALEFGRPPARVALPRPLPTHVVTPLPGRIVLFPSHLWHATRPFTAPGLRASIAFDAVFPGE